MTLYGIMITHDRVGKETDICSAVQNLFTVDRDRASCSGYIQWDPMGITGWGRDEG